MVQDAGSPGFPFDVNQSLIFPSWSEFGCSSYPGDYSYFDIHCFFWCYSGKRRRGQLVNWIEKVGLENIRLLLEIVEVERNHELLLTARNLRELATYAFPYIIPVVPRRAH